MSRQVALLGTGKNREASKLQGKLSEIKVKALWFAALTEFFTAESKGREGFAEGRRKDVTAKTQSREENFLFT